MLPARIRTGLQVFVLAAIFFAARPTLCDDAVSNDSIQITPAVLSNGAPCVFTVALHEEASAVTGTWQGHPVAFFSNSKHRTWFALAGVDVEVAAGTYPLTIDVDLKDGTHHTLHRDVPVEESPYEKSTLSVPDKFVEPDAAALKIIAANKIVKDKAFADSAPKTAVVGQLSSASSPCAGAGLVWQSANLQWKTRQRPSRSGL